ncbi:Hypothetical predicted protein, partial [Podarcis lilfordi]
MAPETLLGLKAALAMNLKKVQFQNILKVSSRVTEKPNEDRSWNQERIQREFRDLLEGNGQLDGACKMQIGTRVRPLKLPKMK